MTPPATASDAARADLSDLTSPAPSSLPASRGELPAAVLWDLDGTLVDTEPIWIAAERELVAAHGGTWTHEDALTLVGNPLLTSAEILRERGVALPPEEIAAWLIERVNAQVLANGPTWRPGARELLAQARAAGIPQAIVTMSYHRQARVVADALPPGTIGEIVSGDMVTNGKPHPEAYLRAAEVLGVEPRDCLAIEDSATGARSALAAGTATVVCPNVVPVPELPGLARVGTLAGADVRDLFAAGRAARAAAAVAGEATEPARERA
ncbi:HAD superfamily hydrolase (TIGR01509 family) [Salana multivorans]|uniref:HAD superfamily hydrolase (TIGR01509 family) n=1 Tax=Salana multivorans TaxID=120377 RepID=A0A3N2D0Z9_9MICO|nr:HAD family phosphatase [Salana multivorans]ROR93413.1 HAD superfamily hydrolase (TIGR01509 family) [Salana multivorans]